MEELEKKLPQEFLDSMQELLGSEYGAYLDSFAQERLQGLRVNTGKITVEEFLRISPFALTPVPWTENGFYVEQGAEVTRHPYYYAGLYYVQEPSAMLPAARLPVEPDDMVLDLCAAPGGKATELGSRLGKEGLLAANDISHSRAMGLLKNLELFGVGNLLVSSETPQKLQKICGACFDKILVDAPCSGEGMFRKDASMVRAYREHGPAYYAALQEEIVETAVQMLKPGGMMLYSTCTFSEKENEAVIARLLARHPELSLCEMPLCEGFMQGRQGLNECVRLFPHRIRGEGHFAALLKKAGAADKPERKESAPPKAPPEWEAFAKDCLRCDFEEFVLTQREERLFALPRKAEQMKGLRFLRTGLYLGDVKKKRFEPSQALAMYLRQEQAACSVSFDAQDERVIRYLKGETVELQAGEDEGLRSWCLVCVDGYPLGWAKYVNGSLRNKYYSGWRMS